MFIRLFKKVFKTKVLLKHGTPSLWIESERKSWNKVSLEELIEMVNNKEITLLFFKNKKKEKTDA